MSSTSSPSPTQTTEPPEPPWARDLVAELDCVGAPQKLGAVVGDGANGMASDADADGALDSWIANEAHWYVALPLAGYERLAEAGHWVLFAHTVEGRPKAVVVVADSGDVPWQGHWTATDFAACDAAEFQPSVTLGYDIKIWSDDAGRVATSRLLERRDCYGGRVMLVEGRLFVSDPTGNAFEPASLLSTFSEDVSLPETASPSLFREADRRLWFAADGSAAFVESSMSVDRWPRVRGDEYMRTDCN